MPPERDVLLPLLGLLEQRVGLRLNASATQARAAFDALALELGIGAAELLERLSDDSTLLEKLATQLTIPETHFFRIGPQIDALRELVLPDLEQRSLGTQPLRFWSAGCSTGEEAYTLAILAAQVLWSHLEVSVLGTDLHPLSLETARRGQYGAWSFRDTPQCVRDRYFSKMPGEHSAKWQIAADLRRTVRFEALNLLSPDWSRLERFELILCRNVMIYFSNATAQSLIERLAAQLNPGGWLILGPSDPPPLPATLERSGLVVRYQSGAIIYQKPPHETPPVPRPALATLELPPSEALMFRPEQPTALATPVQSTAAVSSAADFELQLQLGMDALEAGDLPTALAALRRAVYLEPQSALAQFLLAKGLIDSAQPERARVALRQATRLLQSADSSSDLHRAVTALGVVLGEP